VIATVTNMPWTFVVVFATIFAVMLISVVIWLSSQGPGARRK